MTLPQPLTDEQRAMTERKSLSKKTRFEVFKRDGFKCQYCGKCAPEVVLNVDHIHPVSKGGEDDMMNYVTACADCNAGKSDRLLSDDSVIAKQREQLEELNERREQLEMMLQWREGLREIDEDSLAKAEEAWRSYAAGWHLNESGLKQARKYLKEYGLIALLDAIETAASQYIQIDTEGKATLDSVSEAWQKVGGILRLSRQPEYMRRLYYARGILRKRVYVNERYVMEMMKAAIDAGVDPDEIVQLARVCRNWTDFSDTVRSWSE